MENEETKSITPSEQELLENLKDLKTRVNGLKEIISLAHEEAEKEKPKNITFDDANNVLNLTMQVLKHIKIIDSSGDNRLMNETYELKKRILDINSRILSHLES